SPVLHGDQTLARRAGGCRRGAASETRPRPPAARHQGRVTEGGRRVVQVTARLKREPARAEDRASALSRRSDLPSSRDRSGGPRVSRRREQRLTLHQPGGGLPSAPVERQAPVQGGQPPRLRRGDLAVPGRRLHARLGDRGSGVPDVSRAGREARAPAASVGSPLIRAHHGKERRVMKRSRVVTALALAVAVLVAAWLSPGEPYEAVAVSEGGTI